MRVATSDFSPAGGPSGTWRGANSCRDEMAAYEGMREILPELAEIPDIQWNGLAAEMKANIRLGLAAGECVRTNETSICATRLFTGARAAVALASIAIMVVTGVLLQNPAPTQAEQRTVVQRTGGRNSSREPATRHSA